eukprot:scaffold292802_cov14-Tisochrysis_lutea.AAC.1
MAGPSLRGARPHAARMHSRAAALHRRLRRLRGPVIWGDLGWGAGAAAAPSATSCAGGRWGDGSGESAIGQ